MEKYINEAVEQFRSILTEQIARQKKKWRARKSIQIMRNSIR